MEYMQSKKRVGIFIVLIVISFIGISIASASWFSDLFRTGESDGLEGELYEKQAQAYANVTSPLNKPIVIFVSKPYYPLSGTGLVDLNPSPTDTVVNFSFLAVQDLGGVGADGSGCSYLALPGDAPGDIVTSSVLGNYSAPSNEVKRNIWECRYMGVVATSWDGGTCIQAANYSCAVTAKYYDRGGRNGFIWNISVQIFQSDINMWSNVNYTQNFQYVNVYSIELFPTSVNWTGTNSLSLGASNINSSNNISIINWGNVNLASGGDLRINATRLNHTQPASSDFIASKNFSADDDTSPCDQAPFDDDANVNLQVDVSKYLELIANTGGKNVTFCALTVPKNVPIGIYQSKRDWRILTVGE